MTNQKKAYIYASITVLFWATVSSMFKISLRYLTPYQLLFYSSAASIAAISIFIVKNGKIREIFSRTFKEYLIILILGLLNPFLYFIFLFKAYDLLPAQEAQPITYTWPVIMIFLSAPILKQKIYRKDIISLFICYFGIFIVVTKGDLFGLHITSYLGFLYAVISTFIWSVYWIINTKINKDPIVNLFLNFIFSFPFIIGLCLFTSGISFNIYGMLSAVYVGLFEMGFAFILWLYALKLAEKKSGIINLTYLSPVFALFFIQILTGEKILVSSIIGLLIIIAGLIFQKQAK